MGTIHLRVTGDEAEVPASSPAGTNDQGAALREIFGGAAAPVVRFETAELVAWMRRLSGELDELFSGLRAVGGFELQQIQLGLDTLVEGGVTPIGTANAGGKGAISLTFAPAKGHDPHDGAA